jgi:hypothetical protein
MMSGDGTQRVGDAGRNGENGRNSGQNGRDSEQNDQENEPQGLSTAEKVITAISVAFTVLVFSYVAWHAVKPPDGTHPEVEVVGTEQADDGSVLVHVVFEGFGDRGLASATVEADCEQPPPKLTLEHIPADGRERGTLVCPPGTTDPSVSVSSWEPA